jgi:hypothetical protein
MNDIDCSNFEESEIESITENEEEQTYDLTLDEHHMLYANDIYTHNSGLNAEVNTLESISEAFNKCFVADFIFTLSRTLDDKKNNSGRMLIAKNRLGSDGLICPIFMDTSCAEIKVFEPTSETKEEIDKKSSKKQLNKLKEKYQQFKSSGLSDKKETS